MERARPLFRLIEDFAGRERERLVLFAPVALGAGILLYDGLRREPPSWPCALAALLALGAAIGVRRSVAARAILLGVALAAAGVVAARLETARVPPMPDLPRRATIVEGRVAATDRLAEGGVRVTLATPSLDGGAALVRSLRVRLRASDEALDLDGARIRVRALLRAPPPPAYPGARDTERDAFYAGLAGSGWALGPLAVAAPARAGGGFALALRTLRDRAAARFTEELPGSAGPIAATLMVGISSGITPADRAAFTGSGLAHLLAVAGLHVGIVMGLVMGAVRLGIALVPPLALRVPGRTLAALAGLLAGGAYMLLTGAHLPIIRAFCMAAVATLGISTGRRAVSMRALATAAFVILLVWPSEIEGVSFQMSFAAVACLIAGYEVLRPRFARLADGTGRRRFLLHVLALATTSAIAGLASTPYAAFHFGQVQSWFVIGNLVAVPLTALWVMPCGLLALGLMPLGLAHLPVQAMGGGIDAILAIGRAVSALPAATIAVRPAPAAALLLLSLGLALLCLLRTRARLAGLGLIAASFAVPVVARPPDLVVSNDARLIAFRDGGDLLVERRSGASRFTLDADRVLWAVRRDPRPLPIHARLPHAACDEVACRIERPGGAILLARAEEAPLPCAGVRVLVAAFPLRDACPGTPRVDRFTVWRDGAAAVRVEAAGVVIDTDRSWRGDRPWVGKPPVPRSHARPGLPMAPAE